MFKAFRNSTAAIRLYRCQRFSQNFQKLSRHQIHPHQGHRKCSSPLPNYYNATYSLSDPLRSYFSTIDLDDDNESDDLEEVYDASPVHPENGCMNIKNFLYEDLNNDDELLNQLNDCESEDTVSCLLKYSLEAFV